MRVLIDMNLSPQWADFLGEVGFEAAHWSTLGASNAPDTEIMAFAKAKDYIVLTNDLDFGSILASTHGDKPGVVQIRSGDIRPEVIGKTVVIALRQMEGELVDGALVTVDQDRTRLKVLPFYCGIDQFHSG